ncbi:MAG: histidine phosphatase family protein [Pseudomonadota bacterium]
MSERSTRVVAIRHGETAWNVEGRIQGHLDVPLNAEGRWQAAQLAQALVPEGIDVVYTSDLRRALETAEAVVAVGGQPLVTDVGLRERDFGEFQGQTFREVEQQLPAQAERWRLRDPEFEPGGGESLNTFYARCLSTATRLACAHPGQTIALVAHGGVLDCFYRAATHQALQAPRSWQLGNASINRLLYTGEGFTLVGWADVHHLEQTSRDDDGPGRAGDRVGPLA